MDTSTMDAPMDSPQSASGISCKSLLVWSLIILTIALLIGLAVYKRKFIEESIYGKKQIVPRRESAYHLKRSNSVPADSHMKTMPRMVKKNATAKAKGGAKTAPHQFAYLPNHGKFVEL